MSLRTRSSSWVILVPSSRWRGSRLRAVFASSAPWRSGCVLLRAFSDGCAGVAGTRILAAVEVVDRHWRREHVRCASRQQAQRPRPPPCCQDAMPSFGFASSARCGPQSLGQCSCFPWHQNRTAGRTTKKTCGALVGTPINTHGAIAPRKGRRGAAEG